MTTPQQMRDKNIALLNQRGFKPATWMPLPAAVGDVSEETGFAGGTLRPELEIANRLLCHCAVFAWGSAPSEFEQRVTEFILNNELRRSMTDSELNIVNLSMDDARADYAHLVGWRLENMWSLAWILGLADEPSATTGQLPEETSGALLSLFLPGFTATAASLLNQGQTQSIETVIEMEDRFYLAHNAVRSGQLGKAGMLPDDFDPVADGGAIHERRHSLTWSLAPGTRWDETDLST
tara:strand:- start:253 stop:963 length:711 start_codon:yes stop_codon:yes gene_type:complete